MGGLPGECKQKNAADFGGMRPCGGRCAADRLLLGLNFYGTDFNLGTGEIAHLTGAAFSELRDAHGRRPMRNWDAMDAEHLGEYRGDDGAEHVVYYPSLRSLQVRWLAPCLVHVAFAACFLLSQPAPTSRRAAWHCSCMRHAACVHKHANCAGLAPSLVRASRVRSPPLVGWAVRQAGSMAS